MQRRAVDVSSGELRATTGSELELVTNQMLCLRPVADERTL